MTRIPPDTIDKLRRHGFAVDRLTDDMRLKREGFTFDDPVRAIAVDAADYIWAYLASLGVAETDEPPDGLRRILNTRLNETIHELVEQGHLSPLPWDDPHKV